MTRAAKPSPRPAERARSIALAPVQLVYVSIREFLTDGGTSHASALAYASLLSLIPLAVVVLSVLGMVQDDAFSEDRAFDFLLDRVLWPEDDLFEVEFIHPDGEASGLASVGDEIDQATLVAIKEELGPDGIRATTVPSNRARIVSYLTEFADNLRANLRTIGLVGAIFLLVSSIGLFNTIESSLNGLWHLRPRRNLLRKFLILWALLTLGPILLAASFVVQAKILTALGDSATDGIDRLRFLPYVFTWAAFFFLYRFVPNGRVSALGALVAAVIAGTLWEFVKIGFAHYVSTIFSSESSKLTITYGALALIPIFLFWIYLSWVITLLGVKLSYVWQHLGLYQGPRWRAQLMTTEATELMGARVVAAIVDSQYATAEGLTLRELTARLSTPQHELEGVVDLLRKAGVLCEDAETERLFAATPPDQLTLDEATRAVRGTDARPEHLPKDETGRILRELMTQLDDTRRLTLGATTFAEIHAKAHGKPHSKPNP